MGNLRDYLEPIAAWFRGFGTPELVVHWGHPVMMGIVVFVMGSFVAWAGWQGRLASNPELSSEQRSNHRKLAPWMFLFIALGYTGGVLSLVMQDQPIFESWHFWTGSVVVGLLALNGLMSASGFAGNKPALRTAHAYLGSLAILLLFIHAALGLQLGLAF
ncbi:MAG: DUF4079 domain-containing protein [Kamptonema sp. SIO4C4]|nr:DUF4079 domain-containing protein [Kamptonema sp. SIO4C4]